MIFLTSRDPNVLPYKSRVSSSVRILGKMDNNSRCVLVPCPAASAKIDNNNLTKNGEATVFCCA